MNRIFKCMQCGKDYEPDWTINGNPTAVRCNKCNKKMQITAKKVGDKFEKIKLKAEKKRIKETKKKFKGKDPYIVLAHLKMMLKRSENKFRPTPQGWWVSSGTPEGKDSILQECYDILEAYDIPSKYLIAEALDSKD